jgi:UDP-N-acetylmuramate--alanine ligase
MNRVHFIGVSGIGMSAVAWISLSRGIEVSGSALEENEQTRRLQERGMEFHIGHRREQAAGCDLAVRSAAVPEENPEVLEARERGIPVLRYSQYLGKLMTEKSGLAVAGTHGKTTTTAMFAAVAHRAGLDPTVVCGGVMKQFESNAVCGNGELFIAEACEYERSFLDLPKIYAVILNIEPEHLDYYTDLDEIRRAFGRFLRNMAGGGFACVNGDDPNVQAIISEIRAADPMAADDRIMTIGYLEHNRYRIHAERGEDARYVMRLTEEERELIRVRIPVPGRYNCLNAAMPALWALKQGVPPSVISDALGSFQGTRRRLELLGEPGTVAVYSDYAHHPTEIAGSLATLREMYEGKAVTLVFQPHQHSRTRHFFWDFVNVLAGADRLILTGIYRQRDNERDRLSVGSGDLYRELKRKMGDRVELVEQKEEIPGRLIASPAAPGAIVFMGAGDIDSIAKDVASIR